MQKVLDELKRLGCDVVTSDVGENTLGIITRVRPSRRVLLFEVLGDAADTEGVTCHDFSKVYVRKNGAWAYLFRLTIEAVKPDALLHAIVSSAAARTTKESAPSGTISGPIFGGARGLGQNEKGAGVMPSGKAVVGAAAKMGVMGRR